MQEKGENRVKWYFRRGISYILLLCMAFQMTACSVLPVQESQSETAADPTQSQSETAAEPTQSRPEVTIEPTQSLAPTPEPAVEPALTEAPQEEVHEDRIWVCLGGYDALEEKTARFFGNGLSARYQVVNANTDEIVYEGTLIRVKYLEDAGEYYGEGDFSEVTRSGRYYIVCGENGQSASFLIQENRREVVLSQLLSSAQVQLYRVEERTPYQLMLLLLSYELYAELYETGSSQQIQILDIISTGVERLLMLEAENQEAENQEADGEEEVDEEIEAVLDSYALAACLAKYGYVCSRYNRTLANQAYRQAETYWTQAEQELNSEQPISSVFRNLAAAELYRLTGRSRYKTVIDALTEAKTAPDELAGITYLFTPRRVNTKICDRFMSHLMRRAEEAAGMVPELWDLSRSEVTEEMLSDSLWGMMIMSVVEYAVSNEEYGSILTEHYQFLYGKNADTLCYLKQDVRENPVWTAESVVLLSEIIVHQHDEIAVISELTGLGDEQD